MTLTSAGRCIALPLTDIMKPVAPMPAPDRARRRWLGWLPAAAAASVAAPWARAKDAPPVPLPAVGSALPLVAAPLLDGGRFEPAQAEGRVLVPGATALALQYLDTTVDAPQWTPAWSSPEGPPDRVMLALQGPEGPWPSLIVPLRATPASTSGAGSGGAVFGGSS